MRAALTFGSLCAGDRSQEEQKNMITFVFDQRSIEFKDCDFFIQELNIKTIVSVFKKLMTLL